MTREYYLRSLIENKGSLKDFAQSINMPYSTLLSILKNVGGASCDNVFKICYGLKISVDSLKNYDTNDNFCHFPIKDEERDLIKKYRQLSPAGKASIDAVLESQYEFVKPKLSEDTKTS